MLCPKNTSAASIIVSESVGCGWIESFRSEASAAISTASTPSAAFRTLADPQGKAMLVALKPSLTQADVLRAEVLYDQNGRPGVEVTFTEPAARRLAALTGEARGRTLAVLVDGRLRLAPRVREPIRNGKVYLDGLASVYEARELADQLNALGSQPGR